MIKVLDSLDTCIFYLLVRGLTSNQLYKFQVYNLKYFHNLDINN